MNNNENGFSLVIVVIFMSIAALFVGYLMGSWLIGFLVEEPAQVAEENTSISSETTSDQQAAEEINETSNNLTAPAAENNNTEEVSRTPVQPEAEESDSETTSSTDESQSQNNTASESQSSNEEQSSTEEQNTSGNTEIAGSYGVQIGAFSNYNNALSLEETIEAMGYNVIITDSSPHQVQVIGYASREEAESAATELEEEGYNGFIVIRE